MTTSSSGPSINVAWTAPPVVVPASPRTAQAADSPCVLYADHRPAVVRTNHHHSHPQYLQIRLWGKVIDPADTWVCGNCHDAVHAWLDWLLGEAHRPDPEPGRNVKAAAQATYDWFRSTPPRPTFARR